MLFVKGSCGGDLFDASIWLDCLAFEVVMDWHLADAKNRFSELFSQALSLGPQRVRRRKHAIIVLSEEDYERITGRRPSFKTYLSQGDSFEGLNLTRTSIDHQAGEP
jgi:antitoxin Phd